MRLTEIIEDQPDPRTHRWNTALLLTTVGALMLGLMSTNAIAKDRRPPAEYYGVIFEKRPLPKTPASCPGLNTDDIKIYDLFQTDIKGETLHKHVAFFGNVDFKFDVRPNGSPYNLRVMKSDHPCFEPAATASLAQSVVQPTGKDVRDLMTTVRFLNVASTREDIETFLNDLQK